MDQSPPLNQWMDVSVIVRLEVPCGVVVVCSCTMCWTETGIMSPSSYIGDRGHWDQRQSSHAIGRDQHPTPAAGNTTDSHRQYWRSEDAITGGSPRGCCCATPLVRPWWVIPIKAGCNPASSAWLSKCDST